MDCEDQLKRVADRYAGQGYQVTVHPGPAHLPSFAKDFKVEVVGRRGVEGVLVSVKQNRDAFAADQNVSRYAEITASQPGWRYDFVLLEAENPVGKIIDATREYSSEEVGQVLAEAEQLVRIGLIRPALMTAWAALEAAMRLRLRAAGEKAGWGTMPRVMLNELYSSGVLLENEFRQLERVLQLRNEIAHGFASPDAEASVVHFLSNTARRLLEQLRAAKEPA